MTDVTCCNPSKSTTGYSPKPRPHKRYSAAVTDVTFLFIYIKVYKERESSRERLEHSQTFSEKTGYKIRMGYNLVSDWISAVTDWRLRTGYSLGGAP